MSNDSFIREVNEELRQDKLKAVWTRYGLLIAGVVVAILVGTAAWVGWTSWNEQRANRSGDAFSQALDLAEAGRNDEALEALRALEADGYGSYPVLARMRQATVMSDAGDFDGAVAAFDSVAADTAIPQSIRDMARLRAALVLVDHGTAAQVAERTQPLIDDANAMRHSAREAMGLAAWKEGDTATATQMFERITADGQAPANLRQRAELMLELLRGSAAAT
jgi:hypothetical protein